MATHVLDKQCAFIMQTHKQTYTIVLYSFPIGDNFAMYVRYVSLLMDGGKREREEEEGREKFQIK
jgi:hypothetical protein